MSYLVVGYIAWSLIKSVEIAPGRSDSRFRKVQSHFSRSSRSPILYNVDIENTVRDINSYTQFKEIVRRAASE